MAWKRVLSLVLVLVVLGSSVVPAMAAKELNPNKTISRGILKKNLG